MVYILKNFKIYWNFTREKKSIMKFSNWDTKFLIGFNHIDSYVVQIQEYNFILNRKINNRIIKMYLYMCSTNKT